MTIKLTRTICHEWICFSIEMWKAFTLRVWNVVTLNWCTTTGLTISDVISWMISCLLPVCFWKRIINWCRGWCAIRLTQWAGFTRWKSTDVRDICSSGDPISFKATSTVGFCSICQHYCRKLCLKVAFRKCGVPFLRPYWWYRTEKSKDRIIWIKRMLTRRWGKQLFWRISRQQAQPKTPVYMT